MLPSYKDIVDLIKKGATVEAQQKVMELREAALELQEQNLALRERVRELEHQQKLNEELTWDAPYYWRITGGNKDGPFCQNCWDTSQKQIRLQESRRRGHWTCHSCSKTVTDKSYEPPMPMSVGRRSDTDGFL